MRSLRGKKRRTARGGAWARREKEATRKRRRAKKRLERGRRAPAQRSRIEKGFVLAAALVLCVLFTTRSLVPAARSWLVGGDIVLKSIAVRGNAQVSAQEIAELSALQAGTPLLEIDPSVLEASIAAHPRIAKATVLRLPPSKVLVGIKERPGVTTTIAPDGKLYVVDEEGIAFAKASPQERKALPRVVSDRPIQLHHSNAALAESIALLLAARERELPEISEIYLDKAEGLAFRLRESSAKVMVGRGDLRSKLGQMEKLVAADLPETATATLIDLRFQGRAVLKADRPGRAEGGRSAQ